MSNILYFKLFSVFCCCCFCYSNFDFADKYFDHKFYFHSLFACTNDCCIQTHFDDRCTGTISHLNKTIYQIDVKAKQHIKHTKVTEKENSYAAYYMLYFCNKEMRSKKEKKKKTKIV